LGYITVDSGENVLDSAVTSPCQTAAAADAAIHVLSSNTSHEQDRSALPTSISASCRLSPAKCSARGTSRIQNIWFEFSHILWSILKLQYVHRIADTGTLLLYIKNYCNCVLFAATETRVEREKFICHKIKLQTATCIEKTCRERMYR